MQRFQNSGCADAKDVAGRGSVKLAVEPQDKSGRESPLSAGIAAEGMEILKCPGLADEKDDSFAGIGRLAHIHTATRCAPIQVAVRAVHQSTVRRAGVGGWGRNAFPGESVQHRNLARGRQLKDRARTLMNRSSWSRVGVAALAVVAAGHSSPVEVAVRGLQKRPLRHGAVRRISPSGGERLEREGVHLAKCGRLTHGARREQQANQELNTTLHVPRSFALIAGTRLYQILTVFAASSPPTQSEQC